MSRVCQIYEYLISPKDIIYHPSHFPQQRKEKEGGLEKRECKGCTKNKESILLVLKFVCSFIISFISILVLTPISLCCSV